MALYQRKRKKGLWIALLILSLFLMAVSIGVVIWVYFKDAVDYSEFRNPTESVTQSDDIQPTADSNVDNRPTDAMEAVTHETEFALKDNPVNFNALQEINPDIYAWIYVPNTGIDLPILQPSKLQDDDYYLHRDIYGNYDFKGVIFSQKMNARDFSDPVTVLYGHHMLDGSMFSNLYSFRDPAFFDENRYFYIYMPGHILTYEIVSAYQYDSRHIMNSFDFSDEDTLQSYIDGILSPKSMISSVREGVEVTTEDHIVTLSTCINYGNSRYLVQGVLIEDEQTK